MVSVTNNSACVEASPAQLGSITAQAEAEVHLQLHVTDDAQDGDRYCWLALQNTRPEVLYECQIGFYMNATQYEARVLVPVDVGSGGAGSGGRPSSLQCHDLCPKIWEAPCHVIQRCWNRLGMLLALFFLIFLVVTMVRR